MVKGDTDNRDGWRRRLSASVASETDLKQMNANPGTSATSSAIPPDFSDPARLPVSFGQAATQLDLGHENHRRRKKSHDGINGQPETDD